MSAPIPAREAYTIPVAAFTELHTRVTAYVRAYMQRFDASHDWAHIERVSALSTRLATASPLAVDTNITTLAALLHDVGDHKYISNATTTTTSSPSDDDTSPATNITTLLLSLSCPPALANAVQLVTSHISFSHEMQKPERVQEVLGVYPELGIVQDADRLDALGAVGIARCFVFGGVMKPQRGLGGCVEHFGEKLVRLEGMMKTSLGRELAEERTRRIKEFWGWWKDEVRAQ